MKIKLLTKVVCFIQEKFLILLKISLINKNLIAYFINIFSFNKI